MITFLISLGIVLGIFGVLIALDLLDSFGN